MLQASEKKSVKKPNIAAIIAAILILISGFLFQLFNFEFFGREWAIDEAVMFNLVKNINELELPGNLETVVFTMVIIYFVVLILYTLNGAAVLSDKYSFLASLLTVLYLFLGIYFVPTFNNEVTVPIFGEVARASLGIGTYILPIIAAGYLILKKPINSHIRLGQESPKVEIRQKPRKVMQKPQRVIQKAPQKVTPQVSQKAAPRTRKPAQKAIQAKQQSVV